MAVIALKRRLQWAPAVAFSAEEEAQAGVVGSEAGVGARVWEGGKGEGGGGGAC
jgi:hypothetical protein